jgi:hypothetical protein
MGLASPKRETDVQPTIHGLLFDQALAKNLAITPEFPISGGLLDFLVTGILDSGEMAHVCVELKNAHSSDRRNGLLNQLPAYMKGKGSDFGIYCVLYYRGADFDEPKNLSPKDIASELNILRARNGLPNIRVIILDLDQKLSPSK